MIEMTPVTLQFYKYPRTLHWRHDMVLLGEDHHGTWLGAPSGTVIQRGEEDPTIWKHPFVQLIQLDQPWIPIWNVEPEKVEIYVDVTTVPTRPAPDRYEAIDIDLDVVRLVDGTVKVLDEDEFDEHRANLNYPDWMVDQARATTASVAVAIETSRPPFDGSHLPWFQRLAQVGQG
jgi:protein associated with RNAse G/E